MLGWTILRLVIWDAIALIMTSVYCLRRILRCLLRSYNKYHISFAVIDILLNWTSNTIYYDIFSDCIYGGVVTCSQKHSYRLKGTFCSFVLAVFTEYILTFVIFIIAVQLISCGINIHLMFMAFNLDINWNLLSVLEFPQHTYWR